MRAFCVRVRERKRERERVEGQEFARIRVFDPPWPLRAFPFFHLPSIRAIELRLLWRKWRTGFISNFLAMFWNS